MNSGNPRRSPGVVAALTDPAAVRARARQFGVRPAKQRSQSFLIDPAVVHLSVQTAQCGPGDWVLEIGAGFGALTAGLLASGADVTAYEIDERLAASLVDLFHGEQRFSLVVGDFFRWFYEHQQALAARPFQIVANLPYHLTSRFFKDVLSASLLPTVIVVLVQKEVAERVAAPPGSTSLLSLAVQLFGKPSIVRTVPRGSFWPKPDVDSALLRISDIRRPAFDTAPIFRLARLAFANRRKQIHNSLSAGLHWSSDEVTAVLSAAGIASTARPQELSIPQWRKLAEAVGSPNRD
ncbi:MAG: ribosomal RNA small subunit methyltransferase A [Candidatus Kerfeldbacteria bacterium]|nr:ribosomal RNA small subunit methyltransferase A [Candidatus Kerfeldbacteria bacterium]